MRYIGFVYNELKDKELNHLKTLLEREVVFRATKHIFNEQIRESSDTYLSSVISHLFNILLAPFPFIDQLNEGKIEFVDHTIQSLVPKVAEAGEKPAADARQQKLDSESAEQPGENKTLSKNEKKKLKKKSK